MSDLSGADRPASRALRLDTLNRLRWLAVAGQGATILAVHYWLGFELPVGFCLALVALSAWLNIALRVRYAASHRLSVDASAVLLGYDILQLAALLYLTGGLINPFALLFIVPVVVSASALPPSATIVLGALALSSAAAIAVWRWPLPWYEGVTIDPPVLYVAGIWAGLAACISFVGIYAWRISAEAMTLASALSEAELALAREHHLSALDGLAAATAHELGTPLATIHLVASELAKETPDDSPLAEDVSLLVTQSRRCREILAKLGSLGSGSESPLERVDLPVLIDGIIEPHRGFGIEHAVETAGAGAPPRCRRDPAVLYGLGNIVENATDFARERVAITLDWDAQTIRVAVADDGPGFPPDVLDRLGEPYIGRRRRRARQGGDKETEGKGLGLGVFIAKTLLERTGAAMRFENAAGGGARVTVSWPRAMIEARD